MQRRHPLLEDRAHGHVALQPDAADRAGAVVRVEVGRHLRVFRLQRHRLGDRRNAPARTRASRAGPAPRRPRARCGSCAAASRRPLQNPHRLHHRRAAGRVVGGARGVRCRIEVRAEHHDFGGEIGARNLRDRVEAVHIGFIVELRLHVQSRPSPARPCRARGSCGCSARPRE